MRERGKHPAVQCSTFCSNGWQQWTEETEERARGAETTHRRENNYILALAHGEQPSNRHRCRRETHKSYRGTASKKRDAHQRLCPCSTFLFIQDGQLCIKTHCQITTMLLHVSVTTCFSCLVGFVRYSTIQLVDGWGDNLLLELPLCNLSAWTQLSSNIERVKLAWAVCVSWAVAMAPDHTTNGIHSTNYSKTCYTS